MAVINLKGLPSEKEIEWLSNNIGERKTWLPHYVSGEGWKIRKTTVVYEKGDLAFPTSFDIKWTLEFDDEKMASYYILKFK